MSWYLNAVTGPLFLCPVVTRYDIENTYHNYFGLYLNYFNLIFKERGI